MQKLARIKGFSLWGILSYLYNVGRSSFFQTGKNNTVLDLYPKSDLNLSLSMIRACDVINFNIKGSIQKLCAVLTLHYFKLNMII